MGATPPPDTAPTDVTGRVRLSPGVHAVRRGRDRLQVGLLPGRRAVLRHTPAAARAVDALAGVDVLDPADDEAGAVVAELLAHGLVEPVVPARVRGRVGVQALDVPEHLVADLLVREGAVVTDDLEDADVTVVLVRGEVDRELLDPLVRARRPHLLVRYVDGAALLGPFVVPTLTACLRCTDAHQGVLDPDHLSVTWRYAAASRRARPDDAGSELGPALLAQSLGAAVRDLLGFLDGEEPLTWSSTLLLGATPGAVERTEWRRHPDCGCSWSPDVEASGRMGT